MDVLQAIRQRRSYRAYDSRPVDAEKINTILEAATWAPSPGNSQPWEFIVITGQSVRDRLFELSETARQMGRIEVHGFTYIRPLPFASVDDNEVDEKLTSAINSYSFEFLRTVPLIIAVVGVPGTPAAAPGPRHFDEGYKYAGAAAIQNMLLAAHSLGLGSLWFTFFEQELLRNYLEIEPVKLVIGLVCIGYPLEAAAAPPRQPLTEKVRYFE